MIRQVTGTGGVKLREAASKKYEEEHMIRTDDGVGVTHAGFVYLWNKGLVTDPMRLLVGSDLKTLEHNATVIRWKEKFRDSINEESGRRGVLLFFRKDHKWTEKLLSQQYEGQVKSAAEWVQIINEHDASKWKHRIPGDVTHVNFNAEQEEDEG